MTHYKPEGYHTVTPYLIIDGAAEAIDFYTRVLGATETLRMGGPDGRVGHAEITFDESKIMLADENPEMGFTGPKSIGGTPVSIHVYVEDVDAIYGQAIDAGAEEIRPVKDQFYGDRTGTFKDPFGHVWTVSTHIEDVPPEEMDRRCAEMAAGKG